jgi:hypothetical protein
MTVWIATTVFSASALMLLSAETVIFPKDVIQSLGTDREISADPVRRNV